MYGIHLVFLLSRPWCRSRTAKAKAGADQRGTSSSHMCPPARYAENHARWGHGREPGPLSPGCSSSVAANTWRLARSRESMLRWAKLRLRSKWSCLLVVYAESGRKWGHGLQPMLATLMLWALLAPAAR